MTRLLVLGGLISMSFSVQSQYDKIFNCGYGFTILNERFQEWHAGGGVALDERFSLQLNARYSYYEFNMHPTYKSLQSVFISFEPSCRILGNDKIVSPRVSMNLGTPVWSNGNGQFTLHSGYRILDEYQSSSSRKYKRGLLMTKVNASCDFKIKSFNIVIGGFYSYFLYSIIDIDPFPEFYISNGKHKTWLHELGAECSIMFTLESKKRK